MRRKNAYLKGCQKESFGLKPFSNNAKTEPTQYVCILFLSYKNLELAYMKYINIYRIHKIKFKSITKS